MDCPLRFPGQYHDRETGDYYNLHRYYDPRAAGFHSPDPLGLAAGHNPHSYVPNPVSWLDPLGTSGYSAHRLRMAVGVLTGYELGRPGTLDGFAEWLATRLGIETSLDWPALVLQLAFPGEPTGFRGQSLTPDQGAHAVDTLFALLDEFLALR